MNSANPTSVPAIAGCADLQAKHRAEAGRKPNLKLRLLAAEDRHKATQMQLDDCRTELMKHEQALQGLAAQIRAIPGCTIPN
jgi:hypothetical protein